MKIEHREVIAAPVDEVWALCSDPVGLTRFTGSHMQIVAQEPDREPALDSRYRVLMQVGGATIGGSVIVTEYTEPRELAWATYGGVTHRFRLRLRPVGGGTSLTLRVSYDAPGLLGAVADLAAYPKVFSVLKDMVEHIKTEAEGEIGAAPTKSVPRRITDEVEYLTTLTKAGIIAPMRPDRLVRIGFAARNWGLSPASLIAIGEARHGDRIAIIDDQGALTYAEADRQSTSIAAGLRMIGVSEGDAVALLARNHRGFVLAMSAVAKAGADVLLLNTGFSANQIAEVCRREQPSAIIYDSEFAELVSDATANRRAILADGASTDLEPEPTTLAALAAAYPNSSPPSPGHTSKITILTSGTTGTPKGAARGAISGGGSIPTLEAPAALLDRIPLKTGMRVGLAAPAFHAWGLSNLLLGLGLGCTFVCVRKFDPEQWLAAIAEHDVQALAVVPVMLQRMLELPGDVRQRYDTSSLTVVAASGSALPGDLSDRWMNEFGDNLYNLYGSTEVANATIATPEDMRRAPGTAGKPTRGTTVKLLDENNSEVPQGEVGRIFVGNSQLFDGYSGGGDKQRRNGLMATGDVGRFDAAGRLFVVGRDDDMIVSGGENVFPKEVEDTISRHPAVADVAAIGVDDEKFGQRLRAFVVLRDGQQTTADELKALVKSQLAGYKVPRDIDFIDELPRNATGKVLRRELQSR
ncbi:AMP-binding protein [Gordonia sp. (in: high G+C Gram-positive bacteria)]|jgi:fatty-acyl-CoA synthase|uniref:AMP-binding protein n=1 Tax=Gordonia sp. (in: high G+C Gram-positive bacteria) TaxID=84139 RepID=UPI001D547F8A|nr:AMP-binding protein [Gordonia sp. (in: high G+C Gram-positive bacteria)]MCB1294965.1 AMP-binding protein [Gordonia sp. (in: high G+C Gram-positive bacteria)]HMS75419.1 AMP-binding protein [Gordonia sp. (in: high G+C Gram-positive bacteria)]